MVNAGVILCFLLTFPLSASVLEVGPIALTGSGELTNPDWASYGGEGFGGLGVMFQASGSNGADTVSISTQDVEILDWQDEQLQALTFDAPYPWSCTAGLTVTYSLCNVSIDGITGFGAFSGIGNGTGLIQVYAVMGPPSGFTYPGALLAEAHVVTHAQVTSVQYVGSQGHFNAQFDLVDPPVDPPADAPEPALRWACFAVVIVWLIVHDLRQRWQ